MTAECASQWPPGTGEMARRIREHAWEHTPLGASARWPERLRLAIEMTLDTAAPAALVCGPEALVIYNDAVARLYPARHPDALGRPMAGTFPEAWEALSPLCARAFAGEAVAAAEQPLRTGGGHRDTFDGWLTPVRAPDGGVCAVYMTGLEVSEKLRARKSLRARAERQRFLLTLADALRPIEDPGAIQRTACALLAERLGVDRACYIEFDEAAGLARVACDHVCGHAATPAAKHPLGDHGSAVAILRRGEPCAINDVRAARKLTAGERARAEALGIAAVMGAPLKEDGRLVGALCATAAHPRAWTRDEAALLREVAERLKAAVERARAEAAERQSERRYHMLFDRMDEAFCIIERVGGGGDGPAGFRLVECNPAFAAVTGVRDAIGRTIGELLPAERRAAAFFEGVLRAEQPTRIEYPLENCDRILDIHAFRMEERDRQLAVIFQDITERRRAVERLRGEEQRLRLAVEVGRLATWDWSIPTDEVSWSDEHYRLLGYPVGGVVPGAAAWLARVHADDAAAVEARLIAARDRRHTYVAEFRTLHPDGTVLWLAARGTFFYDEEGSPRRMVGVMQDVTERRVWGERQRVLVAELQHRTRNLMGVVRALTDRMLASSTSLSDFQTRFRGRLDALARVQGLLSRLDEHDRVTFDELVESELAAMDGGSARVTLDGPPGIRLRSGGVQMLALALHELATNAVKYGALRCPDGTLAIRWSLQGCHDGRPTLLIDWRESGVTSPPTDAAARGTGEGRELIEHALPYQLHARTSWALEPDGVHCTITLPISGAAVLPRDDAGDGDGGGEVRARDQG